MDAKTFAILHDIFCHSYNIDKEAKWKSRQPQYKALKGSVELLLEMDK